MPFFNSDGIPIHYQVFGDGPPIVLLHGFASRLLRNWQQTDWVKTLTTTGRQVIGVDLRGHGESGKPHSAEAYTLDKMSDDVIRLMDRLGLWRADLMGYSMGARISLHLLLTRPDRWRKVILGSMGNATLSTRDALRFERIAEALEADEPATIQSEGALTFRKFAQADPNNDLQALAACMRQQANWPVPEGLENVRRTVLIVVGENDLMISGGADRLAAAIPGARLVVVPGRDHQRVVGDPRFKEAVVQFLAEP